MAAIAKLMTVCPKDLLSWREGIKERSYFDQSAVQEKLYEITKIYHSL